MFSVSPIELALTVLVSLMALGCHVRQMSGARWLIASAGCLALASVLSPADPASTVAVATACFICFYWGTRQKTSGAATAV